MVGEKELRRVSGTIDSGECGYYQKNHITITIYGKVVLVIHPRLSLAIIACTCVHKWLHTLETMQDQWITRL